MLVGFALIVVVVGVDLIAVLDVDLITIVGVDEESGNLVSEEVEVLVCVGVVWWVELVVGVEWYAELLLKLVVYVVWVPMMELDVGVVWVPMIELVVGVAITLDVGVVWVPMKLVVGVALDTTVDVCDTRQKWKKEKISTRLSRKKSSKVQGHLWSLKHILKDHTEPHQATLKDLLFLHVHVFYGCG